MSPSGPITTARTTVAADLAAAVKACEDLDGYQVHACMPETIQPPCLIVSESDPFATTTDEPFGSLSVRFDVAVIARGTSNPATFPALDRALDALIERLHVDYGTDVAAYQTVTTQDAMKYLAARLTLTVPIHI